MPLTDCSTVCGPPRRHSRLITAGGHLGAVGSRGWYQRQSADEKIGGGVLARGGVLHVGLDGDGFTFVGVAYLGVLCLQQVVAAAA